jgi:hypothetical protein
MKLTLPCTNKMHYTQQPLKAVLLLLSLIANYRDATLPLDELQVRRRSWPGVTTGCQQRWQILKNLRRFVILLKRETASPVAGVEKHKLCSSHTKSLGTWIGVSCCTATALANCNFCPVRVQSFSTSTVLPLCLNAADMQLSELCDFAWVTGIATTTLKLV